VKLPSGFVKLYAHDPDRDGGLAEADAPGKDVET